MGLGTKITPAPWNPGPLHSLYNRTKGAIRDFANPRPTTIMFNKPTPSPAIPTPTPTQTPNFGEMTDYEKMTGDTYDQWKVPRAVAYGIRKAEGGRINGFNIGAVDSNPGRAKRFDSQLAEATTAAKMFSGKANPEFYGNGEAGRVQFEEANNLGTPSAVLHGIQQAGYAGDPKTWKARSAAAGGAGLNYNSWEDFIMDTDEWRKWVPQ